MEILCQAQDKKPLTEEYLTDLQNAVIGNPLDLAGGYRSEQDYLMRSGHTAMAVRYAPRRQHTCRRSWKTSLRLPTTARVSTR